MTSNNDEQYDEAIYKLLVSELERKIEKYEEHEWQSKVFRHSHDPQHIPYFSRVRSCDAIRLGGFYMCLLAKTTTRDYGHQASSPTYVDYYLSLVPQHLFELEFYEDTASVWRTDQEDQKKSEELEKLDIKLHEAYKKQRAVYEEEHLSEERKIRRKKEEFFSKKKDKADILRDVQKSLDRK